MRYRLLGNSGLRVSEAALGTMTFGDELRGSAKGIVKKLLAGQRPTLRDVPRTTVEYADTAAPPDRGTREVPAVDGRSATRTGATISTAFLIYCIPRWS